ncbi:MAG: helix-turn-helix domain-containing protein [Thermodesulfobacteriota bacterium]
MLSRSRPEPAREIGGSSLDDRKRRELIEALEAAGGNRSEAARRLGVSRVTIWNRMKKYGVRLNPRIDA